MWLYQVRFARCFLRRLGFRGRRYCLRVRRGWARAGGGERGGAWRRAVLRRRGAGLILAASFRCGRMFLRRLLASMLCLWCCITLRGTGGRCGSWYGTLRILCGAAAGEAGRACAACGSVCGPATLWQREVGGRGDGAACWDASLGTGGIGWRDYRNRLICRSTVRGLRCRAISGSGRAAAIGGASWRAGWVGARERGEPVPWLCRPVRRRFDALRGGLTRDWQPDRGSHRRRADDLVRFFVNTLALRTDTSGNPSSARWWVGFGRAIWRRMGIRTFRLSGLLRSSTLCGMSRHLLFQVMLAFQQAVRSILILLVSAA